MPDPVDQVKVDPAEAAQLDESGNPKPKAPVAKPPEPEPDPVKAAADAAAKEAADKEVADKAAADAKAKEEAGDDDKPLDITVWGTTGSAQGDAVLSLLQNSGVTTEDAKALMFDAIQSGDVTKIDVSALEAKVGKTKATIILTGASNFVKEQRDNANAIVSTMHTEVGGEANWKTIAEWAKEGVPEEDLNVLREMINAGGMKAKLAAREMKGLYEAHDGNSTLDKTEVIPKGGNPPQQKASVPLTAVQYAAQLEKLNREHRGNIPEPARRALLDARQKGKAQGI